MLVLQRNKQLPTLPKVGFTHYCGVNALGRGQDAESLTQFITTIAQTMGPEAIMKYIDPGEYVKRLALHKVSMSLTLLRHNNKCRVRWNRSNKLHSNNPLWIKLVNLLALLWQTPLKTHL